MKAPIQIRRPDVADDIRALAALTGISITDTVAHAVRAQLAIERVRHNAVLSQRRAEAARMLDELRRMPKIGPQLTDNDLYDEDGLPK
jgi:hypothetical protein